jgi:hypothetical protein
MGHPEADSRNEQKSAPAWRWRRAFPGDDAQVSVLRRWLECLLPPCPARDDLMTVAVELGTNAVRHTASGSGGRVAVYDAGSLKSPRVSENVLSEDGRGLLMVSALSARMGVGGNAQGRVVWADIPLTLSERPVGRLAPVTHRTALSTRP